MSIFDTLEDAQKVSSANGKSEGNEYKVINFWEDMTTKDGTVITEWKPKMGSNKFDILPWIAGTDLIKDSANNSMKGKVVFDIQLDVHMKLGTGHVTHNLISRASLGLSDDPINDEQSRLFDANTKAGGVKGTPDFKKAVSLYPKKRSLYLIMVHNDDGTKTPHIYAPAWKSFGELLEKKKKFLESNGEKVIWAHPKLGKTIYLECTEESFTPAGGTPIKFPGFSAVEVLERKKAYPDSIVEKVPQMDTFLKIPTGDEMYKILFGIDRVIEKEPEVIQEVKQDLPVDTPSLNLPPTTDDFEEEDIPF